MTNPIPPFWTIAKLGDVCEILDTFRKPINSEEREKRNQGKFNSELFPYFGATGQVGWIDSFLLDGEFVLLGEDGAPFLDFNKNKSYLVKGRIWVNNHAHVLKSLFSNKFLNFSLNHLDYSKYVTGTTRLKLNQSSMKGIDLVLPPLPEQHRIVAKLEELFSQLDSAVSALKKAKEQIKTYKQSVLEYAFEGRLGIDNGQLKIDNETGLPEGWKILSIEEVSSDIVDCLHSTPKFTENGKYCVDTTCIEPNKIKYEKIRFVSDDTFNDRVRRLKPIHGDIFFSREGTIGTALIVPENVDLCLGQRMIMFRPNQLILSKYFVYVLLSIQFVKQYKPKIGGSTSPHLNIRDIRLMTLPIAPLSEQNHIVTEIETRFSEAENLEKTIDLSLKQAESLRQSILKKAFEGRLVPQNPEDEPVEVLLERIRREKLTIEN